MPYFIIDKESKEFGFFGSLPVMVEKFGLDKSSLEYHFSRKKETKFENEKYEIFKGDLERGGSPKYKEAECQIARSISFNYQVLGGSLKQK